MAEQKSYLTPEGYERLKEELEYLRTVRRREVAEHIRIAKEGGDVMENASYEEAKKEQAFLEGRILALEAVLRNAVIIKETGPSDRVSLGSSVTVMEKDSNESEIYRIVGSAEADPARGRISNESPLGKALLGHQVGEEVSVETPDGVRRFRIVSIG